MAVFEGIDRLEEVLSELKAEKLLIVADGAYNYLPIKANIEKLPYNKVFFTEFSPNPLYEDVVKGVELCGGEGCDIIIAIGGGSAIDVAKCIKLFSAMTLAEGENYLTGKPGDFKHRLIAIPTTAGTGSEATRFAVIYYEGKKQSINDINIIPDCALLCPEVLETLPPFQKKCTYLDALCQAMESRWSVNRTPEAEEYSKKAVKLLTENRDKYLFARGGRPAIEVCREVMRGANLAGRAINITQTTAAHAMSYKITSMFGLPHGAAVAVCFAPVFEFTLMDALSRGDSELLKILDELSDEVFGCEKELFAENFRALLEKTEIEAPEASREQLEVLAASVNPVRLKNHPSAFTEDDFINIYDKIMGDGKNG